MARSALLVFLVAVLTYSTDAALTWDSPVTVTDGTATHTVSITEGASAFDPALTITAKTAVTGATVTYALVTEQEPFAIDAATGTITIAKSLDFETKSTYTLHVRATEVLTGDDQTAAVTETATMTINVVDALTFTDKNVTVCVPDKATTGYTVATLAIADPLKDATYAITGTRNTDFTAKSGTIEVAADKTIDKAVGSYYTLTITADNAPGTPTMTLNVRVGDCSVASLLAPFGLLTILMAFVVSMN